jgi:hypothetical protein
MTEAALQRRFPAKKRIGTEKRHNASLAVRYLLLFFYFYNVGNRTTVAMPLKAYEYVVVDLTVLQES